MSISSYIYTLLIGPLEVLFEAIYGISYNILENPGLSIIGLSLVMNLLLLPLYRQTDAIQMEAAETEKRMKPVTDHIKKTFRGNERFMMLQTWYRQNDYKPMDSLKGLTPLALEIPFFMAAYHFLSNLQLLKDMGFGPIANLGAPDGLLTLGGLTINVLPILMTAINLVSSVIYTKDAPLKTKIQLFAMAGMFLVLLYDSPAGLVFYWTINNLFSLIKNVLSRTKKPLWIVAVASTGCSLICVGYVALHCVTVSKTRIIQICLLAAALNAPLLRCLYDRFDRKKGSVREKPSVVITRKNRMSFFLGSLIMTVLIGLMIPSALIHTSPEEFIVIGSYINPVSYIRYTALVSAGFFLIWLGVLYKLAKPLGKKLMEISVWMLCGISVADYMWFGKSYGILSSKLTYEVNFNNTVWEILLNLCILAAVLAAIVWIWRKKPDAIRIAGVAAVLAMIGMSSVNIVQSNRIITEKMGQIEPPSSKVDSLFRLSRTGKNVVVLMMDRGISSFVPYLFAENPELMDQFYGFTYYPNTLSFGCHTNIGLPAAFGGYDYTPREMNRRDTEPLESKHNEALKTMPVLFQRHGYDVTVCDPTYAGYDWIPDLSVFNDEPEIKTHITMGHYNHLTEENEMDSVETMEHKFLFYSILKISPVLLHEYIYDSGSYQNIAQPAKQFLESTLKSYGINDAFRNSYQVLKSLPDLTEITDEADDTFMMMCNDTTHSPQLLQMPDYEPAMYVDNTAYDSKPSERTDLQGNRMIMTEPLQLQHYHCHMASFTEIGKWLDFLRENGVYDNTRIIIVSDHGYFMHLNEDLEFGDGWDEDIMYYNPLLMVKDFGASTEFRTDETFMTNADVPTLATAGLISHPENPFTGHPIDSTAKEKGVFYLLASHHSDVSTNNGTTFKADQWLEVRPDMKDKDNWHYVAQRDLP